MRQSRAPTASQIQNPPPPSSTTKSGRFFGKAGLGEFYFFFFLFSLSRVSLGKKSPQIPAAGYLQPLEHKFVRTRGLSSIPVLIQHNLTPFFHSSLRCYDLKPTLPISRLNHFVTSQVHDSAQCSSSRLPAVISIIAAKSSSWSNYHDNRPSSDQKTNRFFSRRCGSCFPQNHRRCIRP